MNAPVMEVSFFTGGMAMTNGWLVQTAAGALAVDAPEGMAAWLRGRGVTISALLLTHQHFDHVQDAACIQREHGAPILAFAPFSRDLTLEVLMELATGIPLKVEPFRVDELLEGRTQIEAAGVNWRVGAYPRPFAGQHHLPLRGGGHPFRRGRLVRREHRAHRLPGREHGATGARGH